MTSSVPVVIIPPPYIRNIAEKLALYVVRNGPEFEGKILEKERSNPRFSFLYSSDPYFSFYQKLLQEIREAGPGITLPNKTNCFISIDSFEELLARRKELEHQSTGPAGGLKSSQVPVKHKPIKLEEPESLDFALDFPAISALDYDVLKLTALYTARNGRQFLLHLTQREGRNPQFDFLKPNNSLHPLFLRLIDQYGRIITPSRNQTNKLETSSHNKDAIVETIMRRLHWTRQDLEKRLRTEELAEKERIAFESIDWHDFVVAENIEFTDADRAIILPKPMEREFFLNMNIVQRRQLWNGDLIGCSENRGTYSAIEEDDMEIERVQDHSLETLPPAKRINIESEGSAIAGYNVRHDYVPRAAGSETANASQSLESCPICGRLVPKSEISEHIRIESLDPKWKEQRDRHLSKHTATNLVMSGDEVTQNLNEMARIRLELTGLAKDEVNRRVADSSRLAASQAIQWDGRIDPLSVGEATKKAMMKARVTYQQQMEQIVKDLPAQGSTNSTPPKDRQ